MTRSRTLFAVLVAALVTTMAAPASAARTSDPVAQQRAVRDKKAQLAAQLNTLNASEQELVNAANTLSEQVQAKSRETLAARTAAAAADAEFAAANASLEATKAELDRLSHLVVERAVDEYMSPHSNVPSASGDTSDLAAQARRAALLDSVNASNADLIDRLNAAREDYDAQLKAVKDLRDRAAARRAATESQLAALQDAEAGKARLASAVLARKQEVLREIDAQSKADAQLTAIIRDRSSGGVSSGARNAGGCIWPANGHVTSEYGMRWGRLHAGIDIANSIGTPIWAAKAGKVIFVGSESGYGLTVIIDHGGGMSTLYAHMSRFGTSEGTSVGQGQLIGYIGQTGDATGPHVHFETRYGGNPQNPRGCLP